MHIPGHVREVELALRSRVSLEECGVSPRQLSIQMNLGALVRVARGWFVDATTWHSWFPERKHLAAVVAAHRTAAHPPLFSHFSAAVLLGLPLWNFRGGRVHTAVKDLTPRADSVLESVSRLQLLRLGYDLNLQVPVPGPTGNSYFIDFELLGCQVFGECDGEVKYPDTSMLAGRTTTEAVLAEKRRDNWTAGTTGHRLVHWGARDVITAEHLGRLLMSFHVPLPRMR